MTAAKKRGLGRGCEIPSHRAGPSAHFRLAVVAEVLLDPHGLGSGRPVVAGVPLGVGVEVLGAGVGGVIGAKRAADGKDDRNCWKHLTLHAHAKTPSAVTC